MAITVRYLTLGADYGEFSLRDEQEGPITPDELGLSAEIAQELVEWNHGYQPIIPMSMGERRDPATASLIDELDRVGLKLAERIASGATHGAKVRYYSEGQLRHLP